MTKGRQSGALGLLHHVDDAAEFRERHAGGAGDVGHFGADAFDRVGLVGGECRPFLVPPGHRLEPAVVQLVADVLVEEVLAGDLVAFGQAQHLAAERGQPAVEGVEVVDQVFDLGRVELDRFDLGGEVFAQLLVFAFARGGEIDAETHRFEAIGLGLLEAAEQLGDLGEFLQSFGLELGLHLGEREGVVLLLFLDRALGAAFDAVLVVLVRLLFLFLRLFLLLVGGAGGRFADLAIGGILAVLGEVFRLRLLGQHGVEIEDLPQLHLAGVQRFRPLDDRVEGDRAFAQAEDHRVPAGFDPLGDGDLALAAQQLDRTHLAQVHPHRVIGALDGFLLFLDDRTLVERIGLDLVLGGVLLRVDRVLVGFDDIDAHLRDRGHDVLDLVGGHLVLRQCLVQFIDRDDATALGAGDQLADRGIVEVDQRGIALAAAHAFAHVFAARDIFVHHSALWKGPVTPRRGHQVNPRNYTG
jgi:hypothetical protein